MRPRRRPSGSRPRGEPWFGLADVCRVLEVGNPSMAASRLDDDEKHTLSNVEGSIRNPDVTSAGGNPNITIRFRAGLRPPEFFTSW